MSSNRRVLVVGATGMLGAPVVRALVDHGFEVSALVRGENARLPAGVRAIRGDLFDAASVEEAMKGQDCVYLNLAIQPNERETDRLTEREGLKVLLSAARAAGVQRIAAISPLVKDMQGQDGFSWWVFAEKHHAEAAIARSGIPSTIFRASSFFENLMGGMRRGKAINLAGKAKHPAYYLAGADYGRMVARALTTNSTTSHFYYAQGPEPLLPQDLAKRFVAAYSKEPLSIQSAPLAILKFVGLFSRSMGFTATLLDALNRYPETLQAEATWAALGKPAMTVEDYARSL
jgi:uncharacterized protein YbjT (DUF2867 family)